MAKKVTLGYLQKELKKFEIESETNPCYIPGMVLLSSLVCGPNADKIAKFIKKPRSIVRQFGKVIRTNGIWKHDKVCCEWFDKNGGIAFHCDILVAAGLAL
jgi:hypothetical protein